MLYSEGRLRRPVGGCAADGAADVTADGRGMRHSCTTHCGQACAYDTSPCMQPLVGQQVAEAETGSAGAVGTRAALPRRAVPGVQ